MPLTNYKTMDAMMLLSICNMKLRDEGLDLDSLCARYDLNKEILEKRLTEIGFAYDKETKQFR